MIDKLIDDLRSITSNFLFIEYYSHEECDCYKIMNEYTKYKSDKIVLCKVSDGFEKALTLAIVHIEKKKQAFFLN